MAIGKSIRVYDLARELKQDTKRVMEDCRREGADVSVASNSVSYDIADKVRNKYFPTVYLFKSKFDVGKRFGLTTFPPVPVFMNFVKFTQFSFCFQFLYFQKACSIAFRISFRRVCENPLKSASEPLERSSIIVEPS